jgi:hypothetical protein
MSTGHAWPDESGIEVILPARPVGFGEPGVILAPVLSLFDLPHPISSVP